MKKNYTLPFLLFCTLITSNLSAQVFKLHAEYRNDWYGNGYTMNEDIQGYPSVTLQAETDGDQFVIESDNGFNRWRKYGTTSYDTAYPTVWYTLGVTDNYLKNASKTGFYYTTRIQNVGYSSTNFIVMETSAAPARFDGTKPVTQQPDVNSVSNFQPVDITVTLDNAPSPEEKFFIRYSDDNYLTSSILPLVFPGGTGTTIANATIQGYPSGSIISYYAFSSTFDATQPTLNADYDLITLKQSTNQGANYSYTVSPINSSIFFRVNMRNETVSPNGVFLVGSFNNFDPTATQMTDIGGGIYEKKVDLDTSATVYYKFLNGNTFADEEKVPASCGVSNGLGGYNRSLEVPGSSTTLPTVCFNKCVDCSPIGIAKIKFSVNMAQQTVSPDGVHIAGSFNNFDPTVDMLTQVGSSTIYQTSLSIDTTQTIFYKFINGISFTAEELVPSNCGAGNGFGGFNRFLDVPEVDTLTLSTVCFSACTNCITQVPVNIEFRVNMSNEVVSLEGVHIAGTFNGFDADSTLMTSLGGGIYSATIAALSGALIQYKFINASTFAGEEQVPASCGVANGFGGFNRTIVAPTADTILAAVCFSSCTNCSAPAPQKVTLNVNMNNEIVSPNGIHVAGNFNGFDADSTAMTLIGGNVYAATITVLSGTSLTYKFINGNTFSTVESVPGSCGISDGFGGFNRTYAVPAKDTALAPVCFSSCSNCLTPININVTFRVNLSNETISPDGVHIAGSFNGFDSDSTAMTAVGGNVYEAVVSIVSGSNVTYKFINGNTFSTVENVPSACGVSDGFGGFNRSLIVPLLNDTVLATTCYSSCSNCVVPIFVPVHFRVNMSNEIISSDGIHLAGTFNGFDADSTSMTPIGGGIYEAVLSLDTSSTVLFKYINGVTFGGVENVPSACGEPDGFGGFNRQLVVPNQADTLATICFSSCANCVIAPALVDITFLVDMTSYTVSPNGVHIAGTFNGFSASATTMDSIGSNIYAATISLDTTAIVEWKYINGNAFGIGLDESVPALCGVPNGFGGFNRSIAVPNVNDTLDLVCFESCVAICGWGIKEKPLFEKEFTLSPSITSGNTLVNYYSKENERLTLKILNEIGKLVQVHQLPIGSNAMKYELETSDLPAGIYLVQIASKEKQSVKKLVVIK